jgi:5-oxoprolinase (ATP-hydrolysing) subunit A
MNDSERAAEPPSRSIDLNADLGEGLPNDRALLERVTSASICCGCHAGDFASIRETLLAAQEFGVSVGAHPGYPDREGFGRREREVSAEEVERLIRDQVIKLRELAGRDAIPIRFIKPHGALYNQAQHELEIAKGVIGATGWFALPLLGQPGSLLETLAREAQVRYIAEGFPDRRYRSDGSLVPRSELGAVLHDLEEIEAQVVRLVDEGRVATLCIHGDEPGAVANADRVRLILNRNRIAIRSFLD